MLGLQGLELNAEEQELLRHPAVGGVILFSRNYHSLEQLKALCMTIHSLRQPALLIAVDHEGGRVQRFRTGFTALPSVRRLGELYDQQPDQTLQLAYTTAWLMAAELHTVGIDFSCAPVLDLDYGISTVIGDRAFHHNPEAVAALAHAYWQGMRAAGMAGVGKHFPGHGAVAADSHHELPQDPRFYQDLLDADIKPFQQLIEAGLTAIMPAHVIYTAIDDRPASVSKHWLQTILREQLGFNGLIISDDLDMAAAASVGPAPERAAAALRAGCDVVLPCNDRAAAIAIVEHLADSIASPIRAARLETMRAKPEPTFDNQSLRQNPYWQRAEQAIRRYAEQA